MKSLSFEEYAEIYLTPLEHRLTELEEKIVVLERLNELIITRVNKTDPEFNGHTSHCWIFDTSLLNKENMYLTKPFYSRRFGYKMKLQVGITDHDTDNNIVLSVNSAASEIRRYLSLSFIVIEGEFDEFLRWPMRKVVSIMLLNPCNGKSHGYRLSRNKGETLLELTKQERGVEINIPQFISFDKLSKYAVDNLIRIKVVVV